MGLISLLFAQPVLFVIVALILVVAITVHEFAHAWAADHLGDPTPRYQGRVTLNPLAHLDLLGTALLFFAGFGWGKPVMFDPHNLKDPVKEAALIALAGPVSNLLLALLLAIVIPVLTVFLHIPMEWAQVILSFGIFYNCMLAIFNLVPVHPLDGGKILVALLPRRMAYEYESMMSRYGTFILIALILPLSGGRSPVSFLITPIIDVVVSVYLSLTQFIVSLL
jgi:Zn-dependent protease